MMADTLDAAIISEPAAMRGAHLMVSYEELVKIRSLQAETIAKLDAVIALRGALESLEKRVSTLEGNERESKGFRKAVNIVLAFVGGAITSGGVVQFVLPKLLGGH